MYKYSSLPEPNSQTSESISQLTTIEELRAELWLERSLNRLHTCLSDCLVSTITTNLNQEDQQGIILKCVVNELNAALNTSRVAIALKQPQTSGCKISYTLSSVSRRSNKRLLGVMPHTTKKQRWKPGQIIDIKDLQQLEAQNLPDAWTIGNGVSGANGWLIFGKAPIRSTYHSHKLNKALPARYKAELIARAAKQCTITLDKLAKLQHLQQQVVDLENINQDLERTNQLKNQFLANTSHEIRTPLSSILGFTQLLLVQGYNPSRERQQEYLNIIQSSGKHLLALINDILDLSKIEANQLEVQWEKIEIATLCANVISLVKEKANSRGLILKWEIDSRVTTIIADPLRLKQMLLNLIFNALKFTKEGSVGLKVEPNGEFINFIVWDTGTGIAKEMQAELFQPYCQLPNPVVSREEGTGLGLALTRKLAELHGGWIEVESELKQGSLFIIVLPLVPKGENGRFEDEVDKADEADEADEENSNILKTQLLPTPNSPLPTPNSQPPTPHLPEILLVEDDSLNAQMIETYLSNLGYRVNLAKNAVEMWEILKETKPGVILIDIYLPDSNGLELVQQLRQNQDYRSIPIIAQTAMAMKGDREICLASGVDDYIAKPIDLSLLESIIKKYSHKELNKP
jgi:signal transduction histidine kinase/ActR/RegA family two-component response regulator